MDPRLTQLEMKTEFLERHVERLEELLRETLTETARLRTDLDRLQAQLEGAGEPCDDEDYQH